MSISLYCHDMKITNFDKLIQIKSHEEFKNLYSKAIKLVLFNVFIVTPLVILPCQNFFQDRYFQLSEILKFPIIYLMVDIFFYFAHHLFHIFFYNETFIFHFFTTIR